MMHDYGYDYIDEESLAEIEYEEDLRMREEAYEELLEEWYGDSAN